jgi:hypothetical protein
MSELIIINKGDEVESDTLNFNFQCLDEKIVSTNQRIETVSASIKSVQSTLNSQLSGATDELNQSMEAFNSEVNSKLDTKLNISDKVTIMDYLMPNYSKAVSFTGSSYTAPGNGYITGSIGHNDSTIVWYVNGVEVARNTDQGVSGTCTSSAFIMIGKGQKWTANISHTIRFIPCKGES